MDVQPDEHRRLDARRRRHALGNDHSCAQDALVNGATELGLEVEKWRVYAELLPPEGDTQVGVIVAYAADPLRIEMSSLSDPTVLFPPLHQSGGGEAHALLQLLSGLYYVQLIVSYTWKPKPDKHFVIYNADYKVPTGRPAEYYKPLLDAGYIPESFHLIRGMIIDNAPPYKYIEPSDRADKMASRRLFDSLFPSASEVRVKNAWRMTRMTRTE